MDHSGPQSRHGDEKSELRQLNLNAADRRHQQASQRLANNPNALQGLQDDGAHHRQISQDQLSAHSSQSAAKTVSTYARSSYDPVQGKMSKLPQSSIAQLKRLGIVDGRGNYSDKMLLVLKVLKIDIAMLEPKTFDQFLKKQLNQQYDDVMHRNIKHSEVEELAKIEYDHYEKRRQTKIN